MAFARSVSIVTIINIVSAMLSIINVAAMAHFFGTSESIEIYFASTLMLTTFLTLANSAQIPDVVLPVYHKLSHEISKLAGRQTFAVILNWAMLLAALMVAVLYFLLPLAVEILVPGFSAEVKQKVIETMYWILPLLFFSIVVQFFSTFVNAESRFGRPEMVALVVKLIALVCIVVFAQRYDYWALVIGLWVGMAFRIFCYFVMMYKIGYRHKFSFTSQYIEMLKIARQFFSSTGYAFSSQAFQVALNAGISQLPQGTFAIFTYVKQLCSKTSGIFLRPIIIVFFTKASEIIIKKADGLAALTEKALGLFMLSAVPIVLFMLIYGELFLTVLFGAKGITPEQLELGATVLQVYFVLLFVSALSNIYSRMLLSSGHAELMYWSNSVMQLLAAAVALIVLPSYGLAGIIIAIASSSLISGFWLTALVRLKLQRFYFFNLRAFATWIFVGALTFVVTHFAMIYGEPFIVDAKRFELFAFLAVQSVIFGVSVFAFSWLLRVNEVRWMTSAIYSRLRATIEN